MEPWIVEKIILILILVMLSGFFAGSETSLFSLSRIKRQAMQSRNDSLDRAVLGLLQNPRRLMVTLILCNELVNIGISTIMAGLGEHAFAALGVDNHLIITVSTALVTLPLVVILGDMTPKTLAIRLADRWARLAAKPLELFGWLWRRCACWCGWCRSRCCGWWVGGPSLTTRGCARRSFARWSMWARPRAKWRMRSAS